MDPSTPLRELLHSRQRWPDMSSGTQQTFLNALARFEWATGFHTVSQLAAAETYELEEARKKLLAHPYAPSTVQQTMTMGRMLWATMRRAREMKLPKESPFSYLERTRGAKPPDWNVMHRGELEKVLAAVKVPSMEHSVLLMLGWHGMRVSELCALQLGNLHTTPEGRTVMGWRAKGGKARQMVLQPEALTAVLAWRKKCGAKDVPDSPLVPTPKGGLMSRLDTYYWLVKLTKKVLGHKVTPHGLRATFVSDVISRKGIETARQLAGHTSQKMTERYSRWAIQADDVRTLEKKK